VDEERDVLGKLQKRIKQDLEIGTTLNARFPRGKKEREGKKVCRNSMATPPKKNSGGAMGEKKGGDEKRKH